MDVTLNAYPAAVIAGDSDYMVKLQIVNPRLMLCFPILRKER